MCGFTVNTVNPQTIDLPVLSTRAAVSSINTDTREVDVVWSTGAGVERYDWQTGKRYLEVLSMDPAHVRLERLNAGAPLLDSHSSWSIGDVLGAVKRDSARIAKGEGLARLKFSRNSDVAGVWQNVVDEILRSVSIGYRIYKFIEEQGKNALIPTRTAVDWEPFEVSMVPMPADVGARLRSGDKSHTNPCVILTPGPSTTDADRLRRLRLALARAS